jgi:uncharacterized protein with von Willebrand factor type A (vWA) domain
MTRDGHLLQNLLLFGRVLRSNGLDVNPRQMVVLVQALDHVQISNRQDFYHTCRSILLNHKDDLVVFDQVFEEFWRHPNKGSLSLNLPGPPSPAMMNTIPEDQIEMRNHLLSTDLALDENLPSEVQASKTYSYREVLRKKDFSHLNLDEVHEIKRMIKDLVLKIGKRKSRRWRYKGRKRDELRRTLRKNIQYGGNILEWIRLDPKWKPRPMVVIADVSGSMERYTEMLLYFLLNLSRSLKDVEAFVFSTRLTRITNHLLVNKIETSLAEISQSVPDWSGGTRIGTAIKTFNYEWARRVLNHGALVLLISDGWDRGEPDLLGREIARLQRTCHRLIWLNPLLGIPKYEPLTRGIQAALPFIDDHLPVHNLASLENLEAHLRNMPPGRGFRHQQHLDQISVTSA